MLRVVEHSGPPKPPKPAASGDGLLPYLLLALLALVAVGVFLKQFQINPAVLHGDSALQLKPSVAQGFDLAALAPEALKPLGPAERYNPKNLFHKIDGKADLYLTAGFESLTARRFSLAADAAIWCEVFAYEMKSPEAAFAVYSQQRRPEAAPLSLPGLQAYATANSIYLAKGKLYLELVGGSLNPGLMAGMKAMAASLAGSKDKGSAPAAPAGTEFFPPNGQTLGSLALHPKGAFGFSGFGPLYTMSYSGGSEGLTAFAALSDSLQKAAELKSAYAKFLLENGGKRLEKPGLPEGFEVFDMLGAFEVLLVRGKVLAGVHDSLELDAALALAKELARKLEGAE